MRQIRRDLELLRIEFFLKRNTLHDARAIVGADEIGRHDGERIVRIDLEVIEQAFVARADKVGDFLLTAAAIGGLVKHNASISGAECGCQAEVGSASAMAAAGLAAVMGGTGITVRNTEISGHGDGIKTTPDSTYENNWIHLTLAEGSDKHLDGIQGGSSNVTIRGNVLWVPASDGGNAAYINTTFDETPPENITITDNWIAGGTFAVYVEPTKNGDCMQDVTVANNRFAPTHKWGRILTRGCDIDAHGNTAWDEFASAGDAEVIATD